MKLHVIVAEPDAVLSRGYTRGRLTTHDVVVIVRPGSDADVTAETILAALQDWPAALKEDTHT